MQPSVGFVGAGSPHSVYVSTALTVLTDRPPVAVPTASCRQRSLWNSRRSDHWSRPSSAHLHINTSALAQAIMTAMTVMPLTSGTRIGKKRALPVVTTTTPTTGLTTAGHDDDGEEILVEEEPLPHEIAADPALRCRYPSKHCLRARTVKKTGALHSLCAFHRAKANRNQRRLEKRKRLRAASDDKSESVGRRLQTSMALMKQEVQEVYGATELYGLSMAVPSEVTFKQLLASPVSTLQQSPRQVGASLEPFRVPAPLFLEDVEELCELVEVKSEDVYLDDDALLDSALQLFV